MRMKIRNAIRTQRMADVDDAMQEIGIDDTATYREVLTVREANRADAVREAILGGDQVRAFIRIELQESMRRIEQDDPAGHSEIRLFCDRPTRDNWNRTRACTYTKVE